MSRANTSMTSSILDRPVGKIVCPSGTYPTPVVSLSAFAYLFSEMVQYHQNRVDSISELERRLEGSGYCVGLRVLELLAYRTANVNNSHANTMSSSTSTSLMSSAAGTLSSAATAAVAANSAAALRLAAAAAAAIEYKREIKFMNILQFVSTTAWKSLFGKVADSLERSIDHADEFMIVDYAPITSTYVSVPADFGGLSVDSYISGIIAGILEGAGFPARVTAHSVTLEEGEIPPHATSTTSSNSGGGGSYGGSGSSSSQYISPASYQATYSISELTGTPLLPMRKEKTVFLVKFAPSVLARDSSMG